MEEMRNDCGQTVTLSQLWGEMAANMRQISEDLKENNATSAAIRDEVKDTKAAMEILNHRLTQIEQKAHASPCAVACGHTQEIKEIRAILNDHLAAKAEEIRFKREWKRKLAADVLKWVMIAGLTALATWTWVGYKAAVN